MTLTTHGTIGAATMVASVGALGVTPVGVGVGLVAGFVSHFVLDSIPHWDEGSALLRSVEYDEKRPLEIDMLHGSHALRDLLIVSTDGLIGLFLSLFIFSFSLFHFPFWVVGLGAAAGETPDALQFVYYKLRPSFMTPLQRFHQYIQTEYQDVRFLSIELLLILGAVALVMAFI